MSGMPLFGAPKVGGDILSVCSRCKMELAHVVVAMLGSTPVKVICKTCKTQHNYRRPAGSSAPRSAGGGARAGASKTRLPAKSSVRWEERLSQTASKETQPYDVKKTYVKGDVLSHPNFGVGVIEEVKLAGKILVLFREGEKILIHSRGA